MSIISRSYRSSSVLRIGKVSCIVNTFFERNHAPLDLNFSRSCVKVQFPGKDLSKERGHIRRRIGRNAGIKKRLNNYR